jgi:hypothetical protein
MKFFYAVWLLYPGMLFCEVVYNGTYRRGGILVDSMEYIINNIIKIDKN